MNSQEQPTSDRSDAPPSGGDALRVQAAAVAAQQIALDEIELKLGERRETLDREQARVAAMEHELSAREEAVRVARLRLEGDEALARIRQREALDQQREEQARWRRRRGRERAALRVRGQDLEAAERQLVKVRAQLAADQQMWESQRQTLQVELDGVNARIENQRRVLADQEARLRELDIEIQQRKQELAVPLNETPAPAVTLPVAPAAPVHSLQRIADLDRMAEELTEQRLQVIEAWQRLAAIHHAWHAERAAAAAELESLSHQLLERDLYVQSREQVAQQGEEVVQRRHGDAERLQHELIAWQARLQSAESAWATDKAMLLADLRGKETLAARHVTLLNDLRDRWIERRKHEVELVQSDRAELKSLREETIQLRHEVLERSARLDEEEQTLTEQLIALEQHRQATLATAADDPQATARLEELRRRWQLQNAQALRKVRQARAALHAELAVLAERDQAWLRRAAEVAAAEAALTGQQAVHDQRTTQAEAERARLEHDLSQANAQRTAALQQLVALRNEIERMAGALLDQPDTPRLSFDRAA